MLEEKLLKWWAVGGLVPPTIPDAEAKVAELKEAFDKDLGHLVEARRYRELQDTIIESAQEAARIKEVRRLHVMPCHVLCCPQAWGLHSPQKGASCAVPRLGDSTVHRVRRVPLTHARVRA
jgi:hypothetical protein